MIDLQAIKSLKSDIPGNDKCVDCDTPSKSSDFFTEVVSLHMPFDHV